MTSKRWKKQILKILSRCRYNYHFGLSSISFSFLFLGFTHIGRMGSSLFNLIAAYSIDIATLLIDCLTFALIRFLSDEVCTDFSKFQLNSKSPSDLFRMYHQCDHLFNQLNCVLKTAFSNIQHYDLIWKNTRQKKSKIKIQHSTCVHLNQFRSSKKKKKKHKNHHENSIVRFSVCLFVYFFLESWHLYIWMSCALALY